MSEPEHHRLRMALGAYVLGHLDPEEAREVEAHLETCAACRAERLELLPAVEALADVRRVDLPGADDGTDEEVQPPPGLGQRVLAAVAEERRVARRSWLRSAGIAAVAAGVAASVLVVGLRVGGVGPDDGTTAAVPLERVAVDVRRPGVEADAALVAHTWGVEVKLAGSGFDQGRRYRVTVIGVDGRRHPAGEFVGTGTAEMTCNLSSAVLRDRAVAFEVRDARGVVVSSSFA